MKVKKINVANNFSWILIVALIILLYTSYFLLFIPRQEMRVKERGFRILEEYAGNIYKKHDYYITHFKNYCAFYWIKNQDLYAKLTSDIDEKKNKTKENSVLQDINGVVQALDKNITVDSYTGIISGNDLSFYDKEDPKHLVFNLDHRSIDNLEKIINSLKPEAVKNVNSPQISSYSSGETYSVAYVPFKTLMENLKFDKLFNNIALIDSGGTVIYNSNGSIVNDITSFNKLKQDTISKTQGGVLQMLEIQGVKTHVLILPVNFLDQDFYLAGFISDQEFKKKTRTINSQLLSFLSGVLLLLLIGMPILKIVFINRKERLNVRDAHNATVSLIFGISILILLFIGAMKYYVVDRDNMVTRIENISKRLIKNIDADFAQFYKLANQVVKDYKDTKLAKDSTNLTSDFGNYFISDKKYLKVEEKITDKYFPFNEIIFMDKDGKSCKAFTTTDFSNLITLDLSSRNYYKNLTDVTTSWPWKNDNNDFYQTFFIESIKSYNTGFKETALSFHLTDTIKIRSEDKDTVELPYMAVTSHIPSLYDQVLPGDVAFVIINAQGDVLFHSNQSKNLQENFLIECNNHPKLKGAIKFRTEETTRIGYNEKQWLAKIVPMKDKPLYHITLIDLQQTDNKNARIYLFTFYLLIFTFLCIVLGMQIIQRVGNEKKFMKSKTWTFKWIMFNEKNYAKYTLLFAIQTLLVLFQLAGLLLVNKPFPMLVYQLIFIAYSGFLVYTLLKKTTLTTTSLLILGVTVFLIILYILLSELSSTGLLVGAGVIVVLILITWYLFNVRDKEGILHFMNPVKTYLAYMIIWLAGLTVVPLVTYYYSIKLQEDLLSEKNQMLEMAHSNLLLNQKHHDHEHDGWHEQINGSGLECESNIIHFYSSYPENKNEESKLSKADSLYYNLPNPLTKDDYFMDLLKKSNIYANWNFSDSLEYSTTSIAGTVTVHSNNFTKLNKALGVITPGTFTWKLAERILIFFLPLLLLIIFIWATFRYLTDLILGTVVTKWKTPDPTLWKVVINHNSINRILLVSFNNKTYLNETTSKFQTGIIHAKDLFDDTSKVNKNATEAIKVIWVKGLGDYLLDFKNRKTIITRLKELNSIENKMIILEIPYDTDYIYEFFEDYKIEYETGKEQEEQIEMYLNELMQILKDFYRFTGCVDKKAIEEDLRGIHSRPEIKEETEEETLANAHLMKLQYSSIWNNLNRMEKLILFDLADDGMLNFKNRFLINRLRLKGLIELDPYPKIFTPSFQYFLKYSVNDEETMLLERKLGKQGKWKNTKYLIILLLIPLIAFVFISQGTSIEKVIGILTGSLALFSGAMRIMDSSLFGISSKQ